MSKAYRSKVHLEQLARWQRIGGFCALCSKPVPTNAEIRSGSFSSNLTASVDHIIPLALGGTNTPDNFQLSHRSCNYSAGGTLGNKISPGRSKGKAYRNPTFDTKNPDLLPQRTKQKPTGERGHGF